ncbi:GNAT family N-acetyltransferase [Oleisolibacter albus]|uniref:GNAT family N-acetyltransferase n=1 Tax=Oleisolibacter albus TaxID=2171757 RepID=UPI00138FDDDE|nr:GNAT family N-acetyltransferase [Oleisolibacter albus]
MDWRMEPSVSLVENLTLTAWPALRTIHHDGWVLRFANGHTGRANSINALGPGPGPDATTDMAGFVAFCEAVYAAQGLPPQFRITPLCPPQLERELDRRGYRIHNESLVLGLDRVVHMGVNPAIRCTATPEPRWLDAYRTMVPVPDAEMPALHGILGAIPVPTLYAALMEEDRPVALALAVIDRGWTGLYKVATHPDRRGRGLARTLLAGLLQRAAAAGGARAYLQVAAGNEPAVRLYRSLGFRTLYPYRYRLP